MPVSGDVVTLGFRGARATTRRPAVVVSSEIYHLHRPDIIVGVLTTSLRSAATPMDYVIEDWQAAGLRQPSAFRSYLNTVLSDDVQLIGHLTQRDWMGVQRCIARAFGLLVS